MKEQKKRPQSLLGAVFTMNGSNLGLQVIAFLFMFTDIEAVSFRLLINA